MNKRIVILGSGESGTGAAVLAKVKGFDVFVSDKAEIPDKYKKILNKYEIAFEEKQHTEELIFNATEIIKSPGIPDSVPLIQKLKSLSIPIISEIEFAARYTNAIKICITGSNGKTTTTMLTYHILKKAGLNVGLAGNVGKSFAYQVATENFDYYVIELSSFQLDNMYDFKSELSVLLNITPDHLDRYDYKFQNYVDSKFRILNNTTKDDLFIYCSDDETIINEINKREILAKQFEFSQRKTEVENGAYLEFDQINYVFNKKSDFKMFIDEISIKGKHNVYNSMAAGIVARALNITKEVIRESLMDFKNVEHRLEPVISVHGIMFINDSKATNVNSAWYALESVEAPIIWIAGGIDKGNDYSMLTDLVKKKVKAIVCLGLNNEPLHKAFEGIVPVIVDTKSMPEAVMTAYRLGKKGDTVLLSPACASFDLFNNYEDRGTQFKLAVRSL
ncbi:MAG: UDP-N-acetylmuramoyl-L-alanine--D-glutamate ligase [Bacteroidales bacterium]|jgi:UDP-N-acetylmuramoylalanine--D-glutamate ligase|nr:UDP-N-acetylmuramoyl-L-alanine--D-glutamate ligase [Bacteroidales bacterium]HOL97728.1 UDP-N-acetylmuramoyl-L-alanine--D-glutamate ligase [Bacteroidales bacterium]HOM36319.1 UDP-N-acetylmuramoyl-L-alanine--D-glutamate ligase [Bacteroidales bacterium]HPD23603.1 UDP-N-acetylmuramoyl-L-alanine--D-glutamate ligase [Bacteroidales bacterium]HRS99484.1 UDP-N-acetylmuramoyl-L-alanine--D-glutamate ligase [Bacteroidales bacterium]